MTDSKPLLPMAPPLYPERTFYRWGECGIKPLRDLETWVTGGTFHPYGVQAAERGPTIAEAVERMRDNPGVLKLTGELLSYRRTVEYWIEFRQAGDGDLGFGGPHPTPEDAAYSALHMIEQDERERFESELLIGVA